MKSDNINSKSLMKACMHCPKEFFVMLLAGKAGTLLITLSWYFKGACQNMLFYIPGEQ